MDVRGKHDRGVPGEPIDHRDRVRGRSRSPSSGLNRGHDRGVRSRSRSRSRNKNQDHRRSRSRDRHGKGYPVHGRSPILIRDGSPGIQKPVDPVRSPLPSQQRWRSPPYHGEDVDEPIDPDLSQSPQRDRSRSPYANRYERESPHDGAEAGELVDGADPHWPPHRPLSPYGEEEEEGMIPDEEGMILADEEGMIPDEGGRISPETMTREESNPV